jgi:putative SOS response-associated peptidase YedK
MIFNAQTVKLTTSRMWRPLLGKRCIISASCFFEWEKINGKTGAKFEISVQG